MSKYDVSASTWVAVWGTDGCNETFPFTDPTTGESVQVDYSSALQAIYCCLEAEGINPVHLVIEPKV